MSAVCLETQNSTITTHYLNTSPNSVYHVYPLHDGNYDMVIATTIAIS